MGKAKYLLFILLAVIILSSYSTQNIILTDAAIATGINENFMPIKITNTFPKDTLKVFCWFQWKNSKINMPVSATWYYLTDNICILNYTFKITRRDGSGSVSLVMPEGKTLPSGLYRVDLKSGNLLLKSLTFTVE